MKKSVVLFALLAGMVPASVCAQRKQDHQQAMVVSVDKYEAPASYIGSPADAPLQPTDFASDISVQVGCEVYVGRYESSIDFVPSVFAPNHAVNVRVEKNVMFVSQPGDREVKMGIVRHKLTKDGACAVGK